MSAPTPLYVSESGRGVPGPEAVQAQLSKLLMSRLLKESQQLQSFLEFIVKETLAGRQDGLKEYLVGSKVFGRRRDYDPRHDGIVRVQATSLRKRLEKYYAEEGAADPVMIELPRGGYVPTFRCRSISLEEAGASIADVPPVRPSTTRRPTAVRSFLLGVAVAIAATAAWLYVRPSPTTPYRMVAASPADFPQLWGSFFEARSRSLVGFGVPLFYQAGGLYLRDVRVNTEGREADGRINEFAEKMHITPQPTDDTYTGVGELVSINLLAGFLSDRGTPVKVTNARTIAESDLTGQNLVVVSSLRFQTLLQRLNLPTDFVFQPVTPETIINLKPASGEQSRYVFDAGAGISTSYALVSLWPGVTSGRRVLFIGGVHTWATQAATEFVLQPDELRRMAREFEADRKTGRRGPLSPFFQILLRVEGRANHSQKVEYVTHHYVAGSTKTSK